MARAVPGRTGGTLAAGTRAELEADGAGAAIGSRSALRAPRRRRSIARTLDPGGGWNATTFEEALAATNAGAAGARDDRNPT